MSRKLKIIIPVILVFIISTIASVYLLFQSDEILVNFEILSVKNNYTDYTVEFSKVKAAEYYSVKIHNSSNRLVYETTTKDEKVTLPLTNLQYNEEYSLMVFAYDKVGDYRSCKNEYKFIWDEPTFSDDLSILLNNDDYILDINGNLEKKDYILEISNGDVVLESDPLKENQYVINKDIYVTKEIELTVKIKSDKATIDEIHLFNNMNPVTDVNIININEGDIIPYNDVTLEYSGGENADHYEIKIYKNNKVTKKSITSKKIVVLSKNLFSTGEAYQIEVNAYYGEYVKTTNVNITMSDQIQLHPVYISNNWKYVKKGTKLELNCVDKDAKIYYTLDGKNPESYGTLYTEPIEINENVMLRTVAVLEGYQNSVISVYEINVGVKETLKVYLSPSNQHGNQGVHSTGYTNEMDEMNDVTDYIEERLKSYGVIVYRNSPAGNINLWNKDSNYYGVDLKIAIHSNASNYHDNYGIETWVDTQNSLTYSIANIIQNGLMGIYPYADLPNANRGVKFANGALGEANDNYIPFGLLVEIAHHDWKDDAAWIMENKKLIGYNIADSILKYYQIID